MLQGRRRRRAPGDGCTLDRLRSPLLRRSTPKHHGQDVGWEALPAHVCREHGVPTGPAPRAQLADERLAEDLGKKRVRLPRSRLLAIDTRPRPRPRCAHARLHLPHRHPHQVARGLARSAGRGKPHLGVPQRELLPPPQAQEEEGVTPRLLPAHVPQQRLHAPRRKKPPRLLLQLPRRRALDALVRLTALAARHGPRRVHQRLLLRGVARQASIHLTQEHHQLAGLRKVVAKHSGSCGGGTRDGSARPRCQLGRTGRRRRRPPGHRTATSRPQRARSLTLVIGDGPMLRPSHRPRLGFHCSSPALERRAPGGTASVRQASR